LQEPGKPAPRLWGRFPLWDKVVAADGWGFRRHRAGFRPLESLHVYLDLLLYPNGVRGWGAKTNPNHPY